MVQLTLYLSYDTVIYVVLKFETVPYYSSEITVAPNHFMTMPIFIGW